MSPESLLRPRRREDVAGRFQQAISSFKIKSDARWFGRVSRDSRVDQPWKTSFPENGPVVRKRTIIRLMGATFVPEDRQQSAVENWLRTCPAAILPRGSFARRVTSLRYHAQQALCGDFCGRDFGLSIPTPNDRSSKLN